MIFKRYIFYTTLKLFIGCLSGFYLLYAILDFSLHMGNWIYTAKIPILHVCGYYGLQLLKRFELLLPLSLMIASMRTLFSLNTNRELLAFRASGIPIKELVEPIFLIGFFCTLLVYVNFEWALPKALSYIDAFDAKLVNKRENLPTKNGVTALTFKDGSHLYYLGEEGKIIDAYLISSRDEVWHAKELNVIENVVSGRYVDHFMRDADGVLQKNASYTTYTFNQLPYASREKPQKIVPYENHSISQLAKRLLFGRFSSLAQKSEIQTQCFFKLAMPWLSVLILIAVIPFTTRFSRSSRVFITYACGLFGFISFFTIMDGCTIIGCHHLVHPAIAIFTPFALFLGAFGINYLRGTHFALGR